MSTKYIGLVLCTQYFNDSTKTSAVASCGFFKTRDDAKAACAEFIKQAALDWHTTCPDVKSSVHEDYALAYLYENLMVSLHAGIYEREENKMAEAKYEDDSGFTL